MKTRKKQTTIKNYADQEKRPSRSYLEAVKAMISVSDAELKKHTWLYGDAIKDFNLLKTAFAEIEKITHDAELKRTEYVRDPKLWEAYKDLHTQAKVIQNSMADIRTGKTLRSYQEEVLRLGNELNKAHRAQNEVVKKQNADEIFQHLNATRSQHNALIDQAKKKLDELEALLDSLTCCTSSQKQRSLNEQINAQKAVVKNLEATRDSVVQKIMSETVEKPTPAPGVNQELADLQKRYDAARNTAKYLEDHQDAILADKQRTLDAIKADKKNAIKAINEHALHYHANLNTQVMHGMIRLHARFNTYKTSFDQAVHKYIKNKDEAAGYSQQLDTCKAKLDKLMPQLWCENYRRLSGSDIYQQFNALPQKSKDALLTQKPDTTALAQIMGATAAASKAAVSTGGIFAKKPVAPETAVKREHLKKEKRVTFNG